MNLSNKLIRWDYRRAYHWTSKTQKFKARVIPQDDNHWLLTNLVEQSRWFNDITIIVNDAKLRISKLETFLVAAFWQKRQTVWTIPIIRIEEKG